MKLFKNTKNEIYAYEEDGSQDHLIPADFVQLTQEEIDARNAKFEADKQAEIAIKESALAKLAALGLTEDEVKALVG